MTSVYEEFLGYLFQLSDVLEELTQTAKGKLAAAREGDLIRLDQCMKQEQVHSMTLRGMDAHRDKMLAEMGLSGLPLSRLAENYPPELRQAAAQAAELAMRNYDIYVSASDAAKTAMETALREIERMFPQGQPVPQRDPEEPPPRMKTDFRA